MIDYIRGQVAELTPTFVVIDCGGVGYQINITLLDYSELSSASDVKLFVHESIREDAHLLFGFISKRTREMFRLLIGVSGVGPNTARLILSGLSSAQLEDAIASENVSALKAVKGIGARTAQRIIVDLKDKISVDSSSVAGVAPSSEAFEDSKAALVMLGYASAQSEKVLRKLFSATPGLTVEQAIKQALTML
ncbi:MAG: Holliday junction branch migration protein RuvA [Muribaculaceae bacterium]|nr:Holliday junction branch migration protein RuvA [Muribaculaceae bacterium]